MTLLPVSQIFVWLKTMVVLTQKTTTSILGNRISKQAIWSHSNMSCGEFFLDLATRKSHVPTCNVWEITSFFGRCPFQEIAMWIHLKSSPTAARLCLLLPNKAMVATGSVADIKAPDRGHRRHVTWHHDQPAATHPGHLRAQAKQVAIDWKLWRVL